MPGTAILLQWGRAVEGAETGAQGGGAGIGYTASMGPRR